MTHSQTSRSWVGKRDLGSKCRSYSSDKCFEEKTWKRQRRSGVYGPTSERVLREGFLDEVVFT